MNFAVYERRMPQVTKISVLFICLGNICRSPSAHGVFRARIARAGLEQRVTIDSAGIGDWHVGSPPDARAAAATSARGIDIGDLRARQVTPADLQRFDYVIAMDAGNLAELERMAQACGTPHAKIALLGAYSKRYPGEPVPDPYFGGPHGFERVLDRIEDATEGLFAEIRERLAE
jgi:protein-tyrosine phosphatase